MKFEGPSNYICQCKCHTDPEVTHEGHCCFKCPRCHERIVAHLYNEHRYSCGKQKIRRIQKDTIREKKQSITPQERPIHHSWRERITTKPTIFGSTRTRHRSTKR